MTNPHCQHFADLDAAARKLEAGEAAEAYSIALDVMHKVGGSAAAEAVSCWDRARLLTLASAFPRRS
jgi:hypothetical protein